MRIIVFKHLHNATKPSRAANLALSSLSLKHSKNGVVKSFTVLSAKDGNLILNKSTSLTKTSATV